MNGPVDPFYLDSLADFGEPIGAERAAWRNGNDPPARSPRFALTPFVWRDPQTIPPRRWLYGGHYIRKFISATVAPGGLGKSSLGLVEAVSMASGRQLLGGPTPKQLKVSVWNGEDPLEELERRVAGILLHYRIAPEEIEGRLFLNSGRETPIVIAEKHGENIVV